MFGTQRTPERAHHKCLSAREIWLPRRACNVTFHCVFPEFFSPLAISAEPRHALVHMMLYEEERSRIK